MMSISILHKLFSGTSSPRTSESETVNNRPQTLPATTSVPYILDPSRPDFLCRLSSARPGLLLPPPLNTHLSGRTSSVPSPNLSSIFLGRVCFFSRVSICIFQLGLLSACNLGHSRILIKNKGNRFLPILLCYLFHHDSANRHAPTFPEPPATTAGQPILSGSIRFAEVAGETTAECAAVACCCPCGLVNLLVLAVYKVPAGLCRRALKKKRLRRMIKKGLLQPRRRRCPCGCDDTELQIHPISGDVTDTDISVKSNESEQEVMDLEKEMWEKFYSTGFWRSSSQRE
ncbi:hypothetical protein CK203_104432 [Vitis vinifera]|uniref:Uncharacterized protein n=1 Tax=Vitis vinifera TaxID=29760 RepID=A0A438DH54_VITVI|nr:hypothetical protein CK203_104432 [Vitis vinifera]